MRYALRGFYDGHTKYARYYGVGGGKPSTGLWGTSPGHKLFDVDCAFDDNDHEWYDHGTDPEELVNLANDRSRRAELRDVFERMRSLRAGVVRRLRVRSGRLGSSPHITTHPPTSSSTNPRQPDSTMSRQVSKSASSP